MPQGLKRRTARLAYAEKWLVLGIIIGVASGLAAAVFYQFLGLVSRVALTILGSEARGALVHDPSLAALVGFERLHFLPLLLVTGAAASALLVYRFAPEAEGHGTDAAVAAFHRRAGIVSARVPPIKALASALLIGLGGSGGVEGPSIQMGSGIGSTLARLFNLNMEDRRIALVAGMAGALSALFRAPLGTALFAIEALYKRDLEAQAFVPAFIASVTSFTVTAPIFSYHAILPTVSASYQALLNARSLVAYVLLGFYIAPFAYFYVWAFQKSGERFNRLAERRIPVYLKPVLGVALMAPIALVFPHVVGSGRALLGPVLRGEVELLFEEAGELLVLMLVAVALAKIVATSFSIGSGGSGGVFAPAVLSGALLGLSFSHLVGQRLSPLDPGVYAYLGMASFFAAAAKVPLATSVMVGEMGGNYLLIVPAITASIIARELTGNASIYSSQLNHRLREEIVEAESLLSMLASSGEQINIKLKDLVDTEYKCVSPRATISTALSLMLREKGKIVPVVNDDGTVEGVLDPMDLEELAEMGRMDPSKPLHRARLRMVPLLPVNARINVALEEMVRRNRDYVIVVDGKGRYKGVVTINEITAALAYLIAKHRSTLRLEGGGR